MLLLTGCPKQPVHQPSETKAESTGPRIDYVVAKDVDGSDLKLQLRDEAFSIGGPGGGKRVEGVLQPVYFEFNQSHIKETEREKLKQAAKHLKDNAGDRLLVEGRCDWRGTTEYNLALGDRRAKSAAKYLADLGIVKNRMETVSKGDLEAQEHSTEEQMKKDRRDDLVIIR